MRKICLCLRLMAPLASTNSFAGIRLYQNYPYFIGLFKYESKLSKLDQTCPTYQNLTKMENCLKISKMVQTCPKLS